MDDFLANKIIEDFIAGTMTAPEVWNNLQEGRDIISDEKYDEILVLITEQLIEDELIDDEDNELNLNDIFKEESISSENELEWNDPCYDQVDWEYGDVSFNSD